MENNKLDRLFREKAESYELPPSADAWASISRQTKKTSDSILLWKVAAAVTLLLVATLLVLRQSNQMEMQEMVADHPARPNAEMQLEIFEPQSLLAAADAKNIDTPEPRDVQKEQQVTQTTPAQLANEESPSTSEAMMEIPVIAIEEKKALIADEQPIVPAIVGLPAPAAADAMPGPAVTIRYYADNSVAEDSVMDKKGFSTFLARAQSFRPGEFLADLRTAKDDLLRSKKLN